MNTQDKTLSRKCGTSSLLSPQFSPGQLLEDDDLNAAVKYARDLNKLLFGSLFGCGVICGLKVTGAQACPGKMEITVAKGLALDCMGNPIELQQDVVIEYAPECADFQFPVWVAVCFKENCCRPKEVTCSQDADAGPRPTRLQYGYEVRLYAALPDCACRCPGPDDKRAQTPTDNCCQDTQPSAAATTNMPSSGMASDSNICPCYLSHFHGECECGCNCCCVLVGKITGLPTTDSQGNAIPIADRTATLDFTTVRRIRPVLNGYFQCPQPTQNTPAVPAGRAGQPAPAPNHAPNNAPNAVAQPAQPQN
jgi:hypothetical protein